jgi:hypothetical protein
MSDTKNAATLAWRRGLTLALVALLLAAPPAGAAGVFQRAGTIAVNGDIVQMQVLGGTVGSVQLSGSWTGTIQFEGTLDGSTWAAIAATPTGGGAAVTSATAPGAWTISAALTLVRVRASAAMTGTTTVTVLFIQP